MFNLTCLKINQNKIVIIVNNRLWILPPMVVWYYNYNKIIIFVKYLVKIKWQCL